MQSILKSLATIVMALLVLLSTLSLTVEKHYCGDFLVAISYFGNNQGCADEKENDTCDLPAIIKKKSCCKDEINQIKGHEDLTSASTEKFNFEQQQIVTALLLKHMQCFHKLPKERGSYECYVPPNIIKNFQVLHDVFII